MKSKWLPIFALSVGPCAAYLVWALQRGSRLHIGIATLANLILWTAGPAIIAYLGSTIQ